MKYYARWKDSSFGIWYWVIYKKRKWFFDKKISKFYCPATNKSQRYFRDYIEPELKRLEEEDE